MHKTYRQWQESSIPSHPLHVKKVTLCITPILTLGVDQMQKVANINKQNLIAFHMAELTDAQVIKLKNHLEILHPENVVILLASPLFLNNCGQQFLHFLFQNDLIRLVVMDELHLLHHFARSFRDDFDQLNKLSSAASSHIYLAFS